MGIDTFFAKLLGLYLLIVSVLWLLRRSDLKATFKQVVGNKGFLALSASLNLIFGIIIAIVHTYWEWDYIGLITFLGYLMIFKGIARLAYPNEVKRFYSKMTDQGLVVTLVIMLIMGAYLTYMGFHIGR